MTLSKTTRTVGQPDMDHTAFAGIADHHHVRLSWLGRGAVAACVENHGRCNVPLFLDSALDNGRR